MESADTLFTIIQIGDSHIQGDYFSSEIRKQLQGFYGNAGQGILFPYSLAKSYGPRGTVAKPVGIWTGIKTMTGGLKAPLGVIGYGATTLSAASSLSIEFNEKFNEPQFQKLISGIPPIPNPTHQRYPTPSNGQAVSFTPPAGA